MYSVIQGSGTAAAQNPFLVRLKQDAITYDPFDLTGITDIKTCFIKADGTELMVSLVGGQISLSGNPLLGKLLITLTAAQTALLSVVSNATLELALIFGSAEPIKVQIPNAYEVVTSGC